MTSMCRTVVILQLIAIAGATTSAIVDGTEAKAHSRPYMASLQSDKHHVCGGILIPDNFVLTAAHCILNPLPLTVVLGAHNILKKEKSQQRIKVAKYYPHPEYKCADNDIMLLKLAKKAKLNKYVAPLALPKTDKKIPPNLVCDVAGWGQTGADPVPSPVLMETTEKLQKNEECKNRWQQYFNSAQMLCTTSDNRRGVCQGDSGGPLICKSELLGLTSFTNPRDCSDTTYPHVFTKVSAFLPWINEIMKKSGNV